MSNKPNKKSDGPASAKQTSQINPTEIEDIRAERKNTSGMRALPKNELSSNQYESPFSFNRNIKRNHYGWWRKYDGNSLHLGEFDIAIHGKITCQNPETQDWDRIVLELQVFGPDPEYKYIKKSPTFLMEYEDFLSVSRLRNALLKYTSKNHHFKSEEQIGDFYEELTNIHPPREVYEFDYYGFVRHEGNHFYLTKNALITIPKNHQTDPQYIIAPDESGTFPLIPAGSNFYVKPGRVDPPPMITLPTPDETGIYPTDGILMADDELNRYIHMVRENFGELVAGQKPEMRYEGYLIFAYMMSFLFFDEIYSEFKHVVYMYIWGEPSTGKGKLSEILLNFFGQSFNDVDSNPTLKSAENKLANHSQIPVVMDEFHPEKSKIIAQTFNMWFELRQRGVSASHDRSKNAWNPVRTGIFFISNYKPHEDHFRSRCLMIEYASEKRGRESIVFWFSGQAENMQRMFLTLLFKYNQFNRKLYKQELHTQKRLLSKSLTKELNSRSEAEGIAFQVKDRQIENMASLLVTDMFISNPSSVKSIENYHSELEDPTMEREYLEKAAQYVHDCRTVYNNLFTFAVQFLANSAEREVQQTPLQQFLSTLEIMSDKGLLNASYHGFSESDGSGALIFFWSGTWDEYTKYQQGREIVSEKALRNEIEAVCAKGKATTHRYWHKNEDNIVDNRLVNKNRHGYRIPIENCTASWYRAFGHRDKAAKLTPKKEDFEQNED
jgi:hypothetical protein